MKKVTIICIVIVVFIFFAVMTACVKLAMTSESPSIEYPTQMLRELPARHIVSMGMNIPNVSSHVVERFPYVAAVTKNASNLWPFACFASVVLFKWIVTSAHCRGAGSSHRVILLSDFAHNQTYVLPILFWRVHEKFNYSRPTPLYDIAVAKVNFNHYPFAVKSAEVNATATKKVEATVWRTVAAMDKQLYLTNSFDRYNVKIVNAARCYESYGIEVDESLICVDTSAYKDCFTHDFGPIFNGDKLVGVMSVKPEDCDVKLSIFTNISYYSKWILQTTHIA